MNAINQLAVVLAVLGVAGRSHGQVPVDSNRPVTPHPSGAPAVVPTSTKPTSSARKVVTTDVPSSAPGGIQAASSSGVSTPPDTPHSSPPAMPATGEAADTGTEAVVANPPGTHSTAPGGQLPPPSAERPISRGDPTASVPAEQAPQRPRVVKSKFPLALQLDAMPVWLTNDGFDLFSDDDISTRLGLSASYDVFEVAPRTFMGLEVGWASESLTENELFAGFDTRFAAHNLHGAIQVRHQLWSVLAPYARLAAGASWLETNFSVQNETVTREYRTEKWVGFGSLGAGVSAMLPLHNVVAPGISVEGGYLISGSMPLRLDPEDGQVIATSGATLGRLERSGPYLRFGLFCRY